MYNICQHLEDLHISVKWHFPKWSMHSKLQNHARVKDSFKMQNRPMDLKVKKYKMLTGMILDFTLQLSFKKDHLSSVHVISKTNVHNYLTRLLRYFIYSTWHLTKATDWVQKEVCYLAIKRNEVLMIAAIRMNLESIMPKKRSQIRGHTLQDPIHMKGSEQANLLDS